MGLSKTGLPTRNFALQTTWSQPMVRSSIMPRGQQLRLRSTDLITTTSPTARLLFALPYLSRCCLCNAHMYSEVQPRHVMSMIFNRNLALFCPGDRARVLAVFWNWC